MKALMRTLGIYITMAKTRALMRVSGFVVGSFPFMYLPVPLVTGRLTAQMLEPLLNKVRNKVAGWTMKLLHKGVG